MYGDYGGWLNGYASASGDALETARSAASNMSAGANPAYALTDFLTDFPQFAASCSAPSGQAPTIPSSIQTIFLNAANSSLPYSKYGEIWRYCMGLYIAHSLTLYLAATLNTTTVPGLVASAMPQSLISNKSAGIGSIGFSPETIARDIDGFAAFKATTYGQQLATFANLAGMGGMLV